MKLHFNPSTLKLAYTQATGKIQAVAADSFVVGDDCDYCTPGTTPKYVTVTLKDLTFCSGCYALNENGQGPYVCGWPPVTAKYANYFSDALNDIKFVLPQFGDCSWNAHFNPASTPSVNYGGGHLYNGSGCDDANYCTFQTNLYFYVYKINNTQGKIYVGYRPSPGGWYPTYTVFLSNPFIVQSGCIAAANVANDIASCGCELQNNEWTSVVGMFSDGTVTIEQGDTT